MRRLVLVTGAAGRVGTALRPHLLTRYDLRLHDRLPVSGPTAGESVVTGDLSDPASVRRSVAGVDAVVHLACAHGLGLRFEESLDANFRGTMNLLAAMLDEGVRRLVYASSHHVLGMHPLDGLLRDDAEPAPDGVYALGKAFGELACKTYALKHGLETLVIRIGNADPQVGDARTRRMWTSARDLTRLVEIGIEHPDVSFDVVYGVSSSGTPLFSNRRAAELGYAPLDRAEDNLAPDFLDVDDMPPSLGGDHVGGAYAVTPLPGLKGRQEER